MRTRARCLKTGGLALTQLEQGVLRSHLILRCWQRTQARTRGLLCEFGGGGGTADMMANGDEAAAMEEEGVEKPQATSRHNQNERGGQAVVLRPAHDGGVRGGEAARKANLAMVVFGNAGA